MDEIVNKIIKLAEKKFYLGVFAIGVVMLVAGVISKPEDIPLVEASELLLIARLGALFIVLSVYIWVKGNDYKASAHALEIEVKKIELDNEIKQKQLNILAQIKRLPGFDD